MEENKIAIRLKGQGDSWIEYTGNKDETNVVYKSITEFLEYYVTKTSYKGDFILSPLKGTISIVTDKKPEKKKFNLYGDY